MTERLTAIEERLDLLAGPADRNGRVGHLEERQAVTERRLKWAAGLLVSLILAVAGSGFEIVRRMNDRAREAGQADERERQQEQRLDRIEGYLLGAGLNPGSGVVP